MDMDINNEDDSLIKTGKINIKLARSEGLISIGYAIREYHAY